MKGHKRHFQNICSKRPFQKVQDISKNMVMVLEKNWFGKNYTHCAIGLCRKASVSRQRREERREKRKEKKCEDTNEQRWERMRNRKHEEHFHKCPFHWVLFYSVSFSCLWGCLWNITYNKIIIVSCLQDSLTYTTWMAYAMPSIVVSLNLLILDLISILTRIIFDPHLRPHHHHHPGQHPL